MLLATFSPVPWGGYNPGPSFPWLISTLLIIMIALIEEINMTKKSRDYLTYKNNTPCMLPLPQVISKSLSIITSILIKKKVPTNKKEVAYLLIFYGIILVTLSLPFLVFDLPPDYGWATWPFNRYPRQPMDIRFLFDLLFK